jgi:biopolymer transport protein ExbD
MLRRNKKERASTEINAGSMADIAFLLLIFFLVTTTINSEKGIPIKLPPWSDEEVDPTQLNTRNVFSVLVNLNNELLVRGEPMDIKTLRENAKEFILNPYARADLAETPRKAIVSLKNDRGTSYETYLQVYNELKGAYNELWEEASQKKYNVSYSALPKSGRQDIQKGIPLVISEAEPVDVAGGN